MNLNNFLKELEIFLEVTGSYGFFWMFHCFSSRWPLPKLTNFLIWKVYLFQFLNPATVASYISYVTLVLLVTFRHAQFFTGDIFPSSLRGEHLVVRSHSLRCTRWYIFTDFCLGIIFPCTRLGMSKHIYKCMFNVELWMPKFVFF